MCGSMCKVVYVIMCEVCVVVRSCVSDCEVVCVRLCVWLHEVVCVEVVCVEAVCLC